MVWLAATGGVLVSYAHDGPVAAVAFSPAAPQLASVSAGELALWSSDSHTVFKDTVSILHRERPLVLRGILDRAAEILCSCIC